MQWVLMVLLTASTNGDHEGFLWHNPVFNNKDQCIYWANNNPVEIISAINYYYDDWTVDEIVCVREDRLEDLDIQPYTEGTQT